MKAKILASIAGWFLLACASNDIPLTTVEGTLNAESIVREHQEIAYYLSGGELSIEVMSIEEARCPIDAFCVWEGYAKATFKLNVTSETIDLVVPPNQPLNESFEDSYTFSFSGSSYRLVMKDVTPYPTRENTKQVKSALIRLENY